MLFFGGALNEMGKLFFPASILSYTSYMWGLISRNILVIYLFWYGTKEPRNKNTTVNNNSNNGIEEKGDICLRVCCALTFFSWKCSGRNVSGISCSGLTICGWTCCRKPSSTPLNVNFFILFLLFVFYFWFRDFFFGCWCFFLVSVF